MIHIQNIRPRAHTDRCGFTLIELLVVIAIIGLLASLLLPTFSRAKRKAHNIACVSQLRQLGMATRMFADDNDQRLPSAELLPSQPGDPAAPLARICDVLGTQLGKSAGTNSAPVFRCPGDTVGRFEKEGSSYEWNIELNGHRMDETRERNIHIITAVVGVDTPPTSSEASKTVLSPPVTTPLLLDYEDFHPRAPKSGKNVVFMDGHVTGLNIEALINAGQ